MTAKVISNNGVDAKLGFPDGSFRTVSQAEIGFLAPEGTLIDVYEQNNSGVVEYAYVKHTGGISGKNSVNKVTYVVLAFLLGGLGAHKFYAGKTGLGVVYLLLCWTLIPALVALVEAIVALTKTADAEGNINV